MITELRWSIEYVNALEMPDVLELHRYWAKNPPVHILLRILSGYGAKKQGLSQLEEVFVREAEPLTIPSNRLPLAVQAAMLKDIKNKRVN